MPRTIGARLDPGLIVRTEEWMSGVASSERASSAAIQSDPRPGVAQAYE